MHRLIGLVATGSLLVAGGLLATPARGGGATFTTITTPRGLMFPASGTSVKLSGTASSDVTSVDIYCFSNADATASGPFNGSPVAVSGGAFSTTVVVPEVPTGCDLKAVPHGGSVPTYVASFRGPQLYPYANHTDTAGPSTEAVGVDDFVAIPKEWLIITDPGNDGVITADPSDQAEHTLRPNLFSGAGFFGFKNNAGSSAGVVVDGHFAYPPAMVLENLESATGKTYTAKPVIISTDHSARTGQTTIVQRNPLYRCSAADSATPTALTCPSVVQLPVTLVTTTQTIGTGVLERFTFTANDTKSHRVAIEIGTELVSQPGVLPAFEYPNGSHRFVTATSTPRTVHHVRPGPASVLIRSDAHAADGGPQAADGVVSVSGPPTRLELVSPSSLIEDFARSLPAGGSAAVSYQFATTATVAEARAAAKAEVRSFAPRIKITKPAGAITTNSHRIRVTIKMSAGGNGLPGSVSVNGKRAMLGSHTATTATYHVVVKLTRGSHVIVASATDPGGVTVSAKRSVEIV